jgi:hypothetical protein
VQVFGVSILSFEVELDLFVLMNERGDFVAVGELIDGDGIAIWSGVRKWTGCGSLKKFQEMLESIFS